MRIYTVAGREGLHMKMFGCRTFDEAQKLATELTKAGFNSVRVSIFER